MFNRYHIRRALWGVLLTGSMAFAGSPEYLGLSLNINTQSDVVKKLNTRNAVFENKYGYRGYGNDLPVIKVLRDPIMNAQGDIDEAWLSFTPDKKLYRISVVWLDSGSTYSVVKNIFDDKYRLQKNTGRGFVTKHIYRDGDTKITLTRNAFGFGNSQKTSVDYVYLPALSGVEKMKHKIDTQIRKKNVKEKGINL